MMEIYKEKAEEFSNKFSKRLKVTPAVFGATYAGVYITDMILKKFGIEIGIPKNTFLYQIAPLIGGLTTVLHYKHSSGNKDMSSFLSKVSKTLKRYELEAQPIVTDKFVNEKTLKHILEKDRAVGEEKALEEIESTLNDILKEMDSIYRGLSKSRNPRELYGNLQMVVRAGRARFKEPSYYRGKAREIGHKVSDIFTEECSHCDEKCGFQTGFSKYLKNAEEAPLDVVLESYFKHRSKKNSKCLQEHRMRSLVELKDHMELLGDFADVFRQG